MKEKEKDEWAKYCSSYELLMALLMPLLMRKRRTSLSWLFLSEDDDGPRKVIFCLEQLDDQTGSDMREREKDFVLQASECFNDERRERKKKQRRSLSKIIA